MEKRVRIAGGPTQRPPGRYRVRVDNFQGRSDGNGPVPFKVRIKRGEREEIVEGAVPPPGAGMLVREFELP